MANPKPPLDPVTLRYVARELRRYRKAYLDPVVKVTDGDIAKASGFKFAADRFAREARAAAKPKRAARGKRG